MSHGSSRSMRVEPVVLDRALLAVVEHARQIEARGGEIHALEQREHDGVAGLHVGRAETEQLAVFDARAGVAVRRHGVEMAGEHQQRAALPCGPRHTTQLPERSTLARGQAREPRVDPVGDRGLEPGLARNVDERLEQLRERFGLHGVVRQGPCGILDRRSQGCER